MFQLLTNILYTRVKRGSVDSENVVQMQTTQFKYSTQTLQLRERPAMAGIYSRSHIHMFHRQPVDDALRWWSDSYRCL